MTSDDAARPVEWVMPETAAGLLLTGLERAGAVASLDDQDFIHVDLDGIAHFPPSCPPNVIASAVLHLRHEMRQILIARRIHH